MWKDAAEQVEIEVLSLKSMKLACKVENSFPYYVGAICQKGTAIYSSVTLVAANYTSALLPGNKSLEIHFREALLATGGHSNSEQNDHRLASVHC